MMGVVTYITVWQLATELFVSIGIIIYVRFFLYRSLFLDSLLGILTSRQCHHPLCGSNFFLHSFFWRIKTLGIMWKFVEDS